MATPHVAGVAALLRGENPNATVDQITDCHHLDRPRLPRCMQPVRLRDRRCSRGGRRHRRRRHRRRRPLRPPRRRRRRPRRPWARRRPTTTVATTTTTTHAARRSDVHERHRLLHRRQQHGQQPDHVDTVAARRRRTSRWPSTSCTHTAVICGSSSSPPTASPSCCTTARRERRQPHHDLHGQRVRPARRRHVDPAGPGHGQPGHRHAPFLVHHVPVDLGVLASLDPGTRARSSARAWSSAGQGRSRHALQLDTGRPLPRYLSWPIGITEIPS